MKQIVLKTCFYLFIVLFTGLAQYGCSRSDQPVIAPVNLSAAEKIAGLFGGTGKYLPGGIKLGNTLSCQSPPTDYQTKYQSGSATVNITKLSDSTITIAFLTGPFPQDKYTALTVKENGNLVSFGNLGFYDSNTRILSVSGIAPNFGYSSMQSCRAGIPYYYALGIIQYPYPDQLGYFTIRRYEFSGMKQ